MGSVNGHHYYDGDNDDQSHYGGTSLMVQWLRLHTPNAGGLGLIPGQGTRSHMPQLFAATKDTACHNYRTSTAK